MVVFKRRRPGISSGYYERGPRLLSKGSRRKIEPEEIRSCLIPHLLAVFTGQLDKPDLTNTDYIRVKHA